MIAVFLWAAVPALIVLSAVFVRVSLDEAGRLHGGGFAFLLAAIAAVIFGLTVTGGAAIFLNP